ncbi:phosphonopyruvate decarboxylase [Pelagibacteraceae bacterium]|nr:phosphonopyruvate decarboxylase [Pelagibacteraceae bacterium]
MILVENFISVLKKNKINFFTGVPDSILKNFSNYVERFSKKKHIISTNEGSAVSIGIGYHLATKKIPCVYLQNSGLSNAINPLISIASKEVYSIPLFLMIGWRGAPKKPDEPQHLAKGKITPSLLKLLKIDFCVLRQEKDLKKIKIIIKKASKKKTVVACLVERGTFYTKKAKKKTFNRKFILRSKFIKDFVNLVPKKSKIISTTGYTSRELMEIRNRTRSTNGKDFYMVGGMGHSSSVALGYSLHSEKKVFCLDGDGSILMHLGALRTVGFLKNENFKHILLNNNTHESVGGQTTTASGIDFKKLSKSIGYKHYFQIDDKKNIKLKIKNFIKSRGPSLLEVKISNGTLDNLSRPKNLIKIKERFMINR